MEVYTVARWEILAEIKKDLAEGIQEDSTEETLKDLIEAILAEGLKKGILKGQIETPSSEWCMRQLAIDAAINAKFLSSQLVGSPSTAAIVLERMDILNQKAKHPRESWSK